MQKPALVIMAAGLGSRYGGLKQAEPVGPHGELIIDYSIHDAMKAGLAGSSASSNRKTGRSSRSASGGGIPRPR